MAAAQPNSGVSVIVPTLNEASNIDGLLSRLLAAFREAAYPVEIIVADGGSSDGTRARVTDWQQRAAVRVIDTRSGQGLAGDVLIAVRQARGEVIVLMDADLSHPPEMAPLLAAPVRAGACEMVIGSRYVRGGATPGWSWTRRVMSRIATVGIRSWLNTRDPLSGFFAVQRERLLTLPSEIAGFKIGVEVLVSHPTMRVREIPIIFRARQQGRSKLTGRQIGIYLRRWWALARTRRGVDSPGA